MARVWASIVVPGRPAEAEDLWYDRNRWPAWVDGFGHVVRLEGEWPGRGAELTWQSRPGGRGRVRERVTAYEPHVGQTTEVEDESLSGTQRVAFAPAGPAETSITLTLDFETKRRSPLGPLTGFFVRRSLGDSLQRTLRRFLVEREGDLRL